jgi:hypothetical protein
VWVSGANSGLRDVPRVAADQDLAAGPSPAHLVGVFSMNNPAPRLAVATELEELVFAGLGSLEGADPGVDCRLHGRPSSAPSVKWSSASSFPGGLPLSFGMILTQVRK